MATKTFSSAGRSVLVNEPEVIYQKSSMAQSRQLNDKNPTLEQVEQKIQGEVVMKRIRIKQFFKDFDGLRKGQVTQNQFQRLLHVNNLNLSEKEVKTLIDNYKVDDIVNGFVDYNSFCENIDRVFTIKGIEPQVVYSEQESKVIEALLNAIKKKISTKRILLKQPFQDFDRTRCSHITAEQFSRVLTQLTLLPKEDYFELLVRKYIDNGNPKEVNYVKFCDDVDNVQEMLQGVITGVKQNAKDPLLNEDYVNDQEGLDLISTLFTTKKLHDKINSLEQVEKKLQGQVVMKRIRISQFFKDYDSLRKGVVTQTQFQRIIHISNLNLSEKEINILIENYKVDNSPNGFVDYNTFCESIDRIFTIKGIDKDPLCQVTQFDETTTLPARRYYLAMSEEEQSQLQDILQRFRIAIQNKRVLIKPSFEDFDVTKQGYVTKNQFLRTLNQFNLYPDPQSLNLILKRFTDKANLNEVNYYDFCRMVDVYEEGLIHKQAQLADSLLYKSKKDNYYEPFIHKDVPNDLNDLLAKIRRIAKEQRMRISEFLRDFDKLRSGSITITQLRKGLSMCKIPLSDAEFNLLLERFACEDKKGFVKWREMCDTIDEVFTTKNLEKSSPLDSVPMVSTNYNYGRVLITERDQTIAEQVKKKFQYFCKATRLDIKQFFQDWDKLGRNKVSAKQFRQTLATVNFILSDEEFTSLVKMYASEDDGEVKYVQFINDTQPPTEFSNQSLTTQAYVGVQPQEKEKLQPSVLLEKIKCAVKVKRIRLDEYLKDFDPLRKGLLPANKFRGVLSQMKIDLDEESLLLLEQMYKVEGDETRVNYSQFIQDVEIVFTLQGLDKNPTAKPPVHVIPTFLDPRDALTPEEEYALHILMLRLGEVVRKHRILLKPHFQDKDRTKSGKVTFTRLRSIMDFHKLPLTDDQFRVISKRFAYQGIEFNYVEFDEVLKKYESLEIQ